jgi:molybdopterin/thiamine biosynthesis adenylyltransferase
MLDRLNLDMEDKYRDIFSRNIGILTNSEQDKLRSSTITIAGVGGVGGLLAERLVRLGVGCLKIVDPGTFNESDLNRQFGSSTLNMGRSKAKEIYCQLKDINPHAQIFYSEAGLTNEDDVNLFIKDCDLVIDEMDFGLFKQSVLLQREARKRGIYYFFASAIGFGALVVIFDPKGITLEEYDKLPPNVDLDIVTEHRVPLEKIMPVIPSYAREAESNILQEIYEGKRPIPTVSTGVGLASILAASEAMNIILKRRNIVCAPQYTYIDLLDRQFVVGTVS